MICLVVLGAAAVVYWLAWQTPSPVQPVAVTIPAASPTSTAPAKPPGPTPAELQALVRTHSAKAHGEVEKIIAGRMRQLDEFFQESKRGSRLFSESAIGFSSKWRFVYDRLPFTAGERMNAYLREQFELRIYKPDALKKALEEVVQGCLQDLQSLDNRTLVELRADIRDTWPDAALPNLDQHDLELRLQGALADMIMAGKPQLPTELGVDVAAFLAGELLTIVAVELSGSGAILGAGAASSLATLGIGVVVGGVVDYLVSWAWHWYADPAADLTVKMNAQLDSLSRMLREGTEGRKGLRARLEEHAAERARLRDEALFKLFGA